MECNTRPIRLKEAIKYYGVSKDTVRRWADTGRIPVRRLDSGHREYLIPTGKRVSGGSCRIIYSRVSSKKQEEDLQRQEAYLKERYPEHKSITDIGSGLNYKRKGFIEILESVIRGEVSEVVVAYSDRWCRFGFEFFEWFFQQYGAVIKVHSGAKTSAEDELSKDLLEIVTVFAAKYHGSRKYKTEESEVQVLSDSESDAIAEENSTTS